MATRVSHDTRLVGGMVEPAQLISVKVAEAVKRLAGTAPDAYLSARIRGLLRDKEQLRIRRLVCWLRSTHGECPRREGPLARTSVQSQARRRMLRAARAANTLRAVHLAVSDAACAWTA